MYYNPFLNINNKKQLKKYKLYKLNLKRIV